VATVMGIVAQRHGIPLEGMTVRVTKRMTGDPHRRIGRLELELRVPSDPGEKERALLVKAAADSHII